MSKQRQLLRRSIMLVLILTSSSFGATFYVGGCHGTGSATISAAIAAAPAGSIVAVCPGTYSEQVVIDKALTLEGLSISGSTGAILTAPVGGLTNSVTRLNSSTKVWYQILVQNTSGVVNVSNIAIDGTGNNLGLGATLAGLYYRDAPGGKVSDVSFRNQNCHCPANALLLEAQSSTPSLTVTNNNVRNVSGGAGMEFEQVIAGGPPINISVQNNVIRSAGQGIILQQATGTVASNEIADVEAGIGLFTTSLIVKANILFTSTGGIASFSGSNTISSNRIDAGGQDGIDLANAGTDIIQSNTIVNSSTAIEGCGNSVTGDTVSGNTIMDATSGLDLPPSVTLGTNHFYNVTTWALSCSS
jgi:Periplasmic copper-binding protein (NosD)